MADYLQNYLSQIVFIHFMRFNRVEMLSVPSMKLCYLTGLKRCLLRCVTYPLDQNTPRDSHVPNPTGVPQSLENLIFPEALDQSTE